MQRSPTAIRWRPWVGARIYEEFCHVLVALPKQGEILSFTISADYAIADCQGQAITNRRGKSHRPHCKVQRLPAPFVREVDAFPSAQRLLYRCFVAAFGSLEDKGHGGRSSCRDTIKKCCINSFRSLCAIRKPVSMQIAMRGCCLRPAKMSCDAGTPGCPESFPHLDLPTILPPAPDPAPSPHVLDLLVPRSPIILKSTR